ncbi:MAG: hypothetical protein ACLPTZ_17165 [Beijerinckiaceae bacterium]
MKALIPVLTKFDLLRFQGAPFPSQQLRQFADVDRDASRLVFGEQIRR